MTKRKNGWGRNSKRLLALAVAAAGLGSLFQGGQAQAATIVWAGAASATWDTTGTNWAGTPSNPWTSANGASNVASFTGGSSPVNVSGIVYADELNLNSGFTLQGTGTITLTGTDHLINDNVNSAGTDTINAVIAGTSGITITNHYGNGSILVLGGSNTYTGGTVITGNTGTIRLGTTTALGTGNNLSIATYTSSYQSYVDLNGNNTSIGNLTGDAYSFIENDKASTTATLTVTEAGSTTMAGVMRNYNTTGGTLALTKSGTGALTLSGANTYTGTTTITAGTLINGSATTFTSKGTLVMSGSGIFDLGGFNAAVTDITSSTAGNTITNNTTGTATLGISSQASTVSALIKDGGSGKVVAVNLTNSNSSTTPFALTGSNTFSGGVTLLNSTNGTRLRITGLVTTVGSAGAITSSPFGTGSITIGQAATDKAGILLDTVNGITIVNNIVFNTALGTDVPGIRLDTTGHTFSGKITANLSNAMFAGAGAATLTGQITGSNGLQLNTSGPTITLNNAGTADNYVGDTTIGTGSTLVLGAGAQIPNGTGTGNVNVAGTFNLGGFSQTINGLSGVGTVDGGSGTPTFTVGGNNATGAVNSFGGVIKNSAGSLALTKTGTGVLTLYGSNTYSGATNVNAGTLTLGSAGVGGVLYSGVNGSPGTITVAAGATLNDAGAINALSNGMSGANGNVASWTVNGTITNTSTTTTSTPPTINLNSGTLTGTTTIGTYGSFFFGQSSGTTLTASGTSNTISAQALGLSAALTLSTPIATDALSISSIIGVASNLSGSLTKSGLGTVNLSGANIYTGNVTVNGGVLNANNGTALGNVSTATGRTITVNSGGTLALNVNNVTSGTPSANTPAITINGGTLNATRYNASGNSASSNGLTLQNGGNLFLNNTTDGTPYFGWQFGDTVTVNGTSASSITALNTTNSVGDLYATASGGTTFNVGTTAGGTDLSVSAVLADQGLTGAAVAAALIKTGPGNMQLAAANTYTGTTTVNAGTLTLANNLALQNSALVTTGAGAVALSGVTTPTFGGLSGATGDLATVISSGYSGVTALTLNPQAGVTVTYGGAIANGSGALSLTKSGAGTQSLSGANTYTGGTTVSTGTLEFAKMVSLYNSTPASWTAANINVKSGATLALNVDSAGTAGFDSGNLNTLLTNISVAGSTSVGLQSGAILGFDTSTATSGTFTYGNAIANSTGTNGGAIGVTKLGAGTLTLSVANSYTGGTKINAGTLVAQNVSALGAATNPLTLAGGTLDLQTDTSINALNTTVSANSTIISDTFTNGTAGITHTLGTLSIGAQTLTITQGANATGTTAGVTFGNTTLTGNATVSPAAGTTLTLGSVTGGYSLTMSGPGNAVLSSTGNNPTGGLIINGGTLTMAVNNAVGQFPLTVNSPGSLNFGNGQIFGVLNGNGTITENTNTLYTRSASNGNFSGTINGTGGYQKDSSGTEILSGANTYSGATLITTQIASGGVLSLANPNAIQNSSSVSVASGTTLQFSGGGTFATAGTISIAGTGGSVASTPGALWFGQGGSWTSTLNAPITLTAAATISSYGNVMTQTLGGAIGGTGPLTISSAGGTPTDKAIWTLGAASNYSGNTVINNNSSLIDITVKLGVDNALPMTTSLNLQGTGANYAGAFSTLDLNGHAQQLASLTDTGSTATVASFGKRVINSSGTLATLTINNSAADTFGTTGTNVLAGTIGGLTAGGAAANNLALSKTGAGALTLAGANTYTGGTSISAGTLIVGAASALGNNSVTTVGSSGTLVLDTTNSTARTVSNNLVLTGGTVQGAQDNTGSGGTITFGSGFVVHTFLASGTLTVPGALTAGNVSALIVGGGGGGGGGVSGSVYPYGGGGGQVVNNTNTVAFASGANTITVGAGGAGVGNGAGNNGTASVAGGITAAAGLGPVLATTNTGKGGTSGSGSKLGGTASGTAAGGGGGDSAAGAAAPNGTTGGAGGAGTADTAIASLTGTYYGGGGGGQSNTTQGAGGLGGGGAGGVAGTANTGGGGGGSAAGGSGIVVVQYTYNPIFAGASVTLSGSVDVQSASTLDAFGSGGLLNLQGAMTTSTGTGGINIASSVGTGGIVQYSTVAKAYAGDTSIGAGAILQANLLNVMPNGATAGNLVLNGVASGGAPTFNLNGYSQQINGLNGTTNTVLGTVLNNATSTPATLTVGNNNATAAFAGIIANGTSTVALTKTGSGTETLTGANTYTGGTTVSGGNLTLSGSGAINSSSGIIVNGSGATFLQTSSVAVSPTVTVTQGTLTGNGTVNTVNVGAGTGGIISNNNGVGGAPLMIGALTFNGGATVNTFSSDTTAPIITTSLASSAAGIVTINPSAASWTTGATYNLISYSGGSIGGAGFGQFALGSILGRNARQTAGNFADSGSAITLTINGDTPYWVGGGDGNWNLASTNNWNLVTAGTATTFLVNDTVVFDDNAPGSDPISVNIDAANVNPFSTTFNNSTKNYILSSTGSFGISTGSLTMNGSGTVTISTGNTYAGGTFINAGSVILSGSGTLGTGSALTLGGGQLDLGGSSQTVGAVSITAPAASGNTIQNGSLIGTSYAASNTAGNALIAANLLANGAAGFTMTGNGAVTLSGANTYTGATNINGGSVIISGSGTLGTGSALTLGGGQLDLGGSSQTVGAVSITAPAASGNTIQNGNLTGTSYAASNTTGTAVINANLLVNGTAGFTKTGAGTVTLSGTNTFTGATTVSAGALQLQNASAIANSALKYSTGTTLNLRSDANATFLTTGVTAAANSDPFVWNIDVNQINAGNTGNTLILQNVGQLMGAYAFTGSTLNVSGGNNYTLQMGSGAAGTGAINFWNNLTLNSGSGATLSIPGGIAVNYAGSYTFATGGAGNISIGVITGYSGKTLTPTFGGSGTVLLSGSNNFGGVTGTISTTGTLNLGNPAALTGLTALTISGAATLDNTSGAAFTLSGNPTQAWNSNFTFNGSTGAPSNLNLGTGAVTPNAARTVTVTNAATTLTVGGAIGGTYALTKAGAGNLTLAGTNTFTGATTINAGTLAISSTGQLYSNATGGVTTVNSGGTLQVYSWQYALNGSIGNPYFGPSTLIVNGGTITYTGVGENSGDNNGRTFAIGTGGATLNAAGTGTWYLTADATQSLQNQDIVNGLTLTGSGNGRNDKNLTGSGGSLTKSGAGTWILTGTNTYTGTTAIGAGTLQAAATTALPNYNIGGKLAVANGGTLAVNYGGTSDWTGAQVDSLLSNNASAFASGSALAFDTTNGSGVYATNITVTALGITKLGANALTLSGTNTYAGGTSIAAGVLDFQTTSARPSTGGTTVAAGATLGLGINGTGGYALTDVDNAFAGNFTGNLAGVTMANASLVGVDTTASSLTYATSIATTTLGLAKLGTNTLTLTGANAYSGPTLIGAGTLQLGSSSALGTTSGLSIWSAGKLDLNGYSPTIAALAAGTGTITDNSSGTGISTLTITGALGGGNATLITDGPTQHVAVVATNGNGVVLLTNAANTFSGGLTLTNNARVRDSITSTGSPGALTSGTLGTGPITIGTGPTDTGTIYISAANQTINYALVSNTTKGTDVSGDVRVDVTGLTLAGTITANLADFAVGGYSSGAATITGQITGPNGLRVLNSYYTGTSSYRNQTTTLTLANTSLTNLNNYAGATTVDGYEILAIGTGVANQIPHGPGTGNVTVNGYFNLNGYSQTIDGLAGTNAATVVDGVSGSPTLTIGDNNATASFSGMIKNTAGALTLAKIGSGTETLSGSNSFSGGITITGGTLSLTGSNTYSGGTTITSGTVTTGNVTATAGGSSALGSAVPANIITINTGGLLSGTTNNWLDNTNSALNGTNAHKIVINGGTLQSGNSSSNGITGLGNTTLNNGTIAVGNGYSGWNYCAYTVMGNITVGATSGQSTSPSYISTVSGATAGHASIEISNGANSWNGTMTLNVADVTNSAASDLIVSAPLIYGTVKLQGYNGTAGTVELTTGAGNTNGVNWIINAGTLKTTADNVFGTNANITGTDPSTTFNLGGYTQGVGGLGASGAGNGYRGTITNGTLNLNGNNAYFQNGSFDMNLTGSGASRLWIGGDATATVYLGGTNHSTYSDTNSTIIGNATTGNAGTVSLLSNTALGPAGQYAQLFVGTLDFNGQANITGAGLLLASGASSTLVNNNTSSAASYAGNVNISSGGAPNIGGAGNMTLSGTISNGGLGFTKIGGGKLSLAGPNTYTGGTTLNAGILNAGVGQNGTTSGPLGANGNIVFGGGTLQFSSASAPWDPSARIAAGTSTSAVAIDTFGQPVTFASNLGPSLSGGLTLNDTYSGTKGTLTLSGSNTYIGGTAINGGVLAVTNDNNLGNGGNLSFGGGTLLNGGTTFATSRSIALAAGGGTLDTGTGNSTFSGPVTGAYPLTLQGSGSGTYSGAIGTSITSIGTLVVLGPGTWTLGANAYTAGTSISAGTLIVNGSLSGDTTISGGTLASAGSITGNTTLTGSGIINLSGGTIGGTLAVTGGNWNGTGIVTGAITASSGTFTIGTGQSLTALAGMNLSGGNLILNSGAALNGNLNMTGGMLAAADSTGTITGNVSYASSSNSTFAGSIAGSGNTLTLGGSGNLTLTGSNTYTGSTTINSGTLQIGGTGVLGGGGTYSGAIVNNAALVYGSSANQTLSGQITGAGAVTMAGSGILSLTNTTNSYGGGTSITTGTLNFSNGALGGGPITFNGSGAAAGTLQYATGNTQDVSALIMNSTGPIALDPNGGTVTLGTLDSSNVGGLTLAASAGTLVLNAVNNYSGITTVNGGQLSVSNLAGAAGTPDSLGAFSSNNGYLVLNGGTLNYTGSDATTHRTFSLNQTGISGDVTITSTGGGALSFAPDPLIPAHNYIAASNPATLTLAGEGTGTAANTLGLKLTDSGTAAAVSLVKAGSGTWILAAGIDNTLVNAPGLWSGNTTISGGTLQLGATEALPSLSTLKENKGSGTNGNVLIASGATLDLHGYGNTINGLGDAGILDTAHPGLITNLQANSTALLAVGDNNQTTTFSGVIQNGATVSNGVVALAKFGAGILTLNGSNTYSGGTTIQNGTVVLGAPGALPSGTALVMSPTTNTGGNIPTLDLGGQNVSVSTLTGTTAASAAVPLGYDHIVVEGWNYTKTSGGFAGNTVTGGNVIELFDSSNQPLLPSGLLVGQTFTSSDFPSGTTIAAISGLYVQLNKSFTGTIVNHQPANSSGTFGGVIPGTSSNTPIISNNGTNAALLTIGTGVSGNSSTYAGVIQDSLGSGHSTVALELTGTNSLTLTGANTFTGGTTIDSGSALVIGDGVTSGSRIAGNITNNSALTINTPDNWTYGGVISNSGTLTKNGSGSLALSGANTYSGPTTITGGTLQIGNGGATGALATTSAITNNGNLAFNRCNTVTQGTDFAAVIAGAGNVIQAGSGVLVLLGSNTYTGTTTISTGTLSIDTVAVSTNAQALGQGSTVNLGTAGTASGTLLYTGAGGTLDKAINALGNGGDTIQNSNSSTGVLVLSSTLTKSGTVLNLNGGTSGINVTGRITGGSSASFNSDLVITGGTTTLSNVNTYYGPTAVVSGGTLINGIANALPTGTVLTLGATTDGAVTNTYNLNGNNQAIAALNSLSNGGSTNGNIVTNTGTSTLTLTGINGDLVAVNGTFGGIIQNGTGTTSLAVSGGTQTLAGANTYTGTTTVTGGTLNVTGSLANNGSGSVMVQVGTDASFATNPQISRNVAGSYVGLGATASGPGSTLRTSSGAYPTTADITGSTSSATVSMQWLAQTSADTHIVFSDVLHLTGTGADTYVLEMSYDPNLALLQGTPESALFLGQLLPGGWVNAAGQDSGGTATLTHDLGSWTSNGRPTAVGTYGVDTANHEVWAVLDHSGTFAVIPEPTSLGLLGLGALGLLARRGKRRG